MPDAISNTSPLLYLHRINGMSWLPRLFTGIYVPGAVVFELMEGRQKVKGWGQVLRAAGQGRVIQRVESPPRKEGHPPGSESLEVWW